MEHLASLSLFQYAIKATTEHDILNISTFPANYKGWGKKKKTDFIMFTNPASKTFVFFPCRNKRSFHFFGGSSVENIQT